MITKQHGPVIFIDDDEEDVWLGDRRSLCVGDTQDAKQ